MDLIKRNLLDNIDGDYQKFSEKIIPNVHNIKGIRLPILKKIAKEIYRNGNYEDFINSTSADFMEETMLRGIVIGMIKDSPEKILGYVKNYIPQINNWALCDTFCNGLKFTNKNKELVWDFIQPYLKSNREYDIRFGVVMLLSYYIREDYLDEIFRIFENITHEGYYVRMGVAWAVSICYIKFPEKTLQFLKTCTLDDWTYNKTIQKIIDSYRVSNEEKEVLKTMKRKVVKK